MPSPYQPYSNVPHQGYTAGLHYSQLGHPWGEQDHRVGAALMLTGIGLALLVGYIVAAFTIAEAATYLALLLLFGVAMTLFGGLCLLFSLVEWAAIRFFPSKKYCGRCAFYHPQNDDYEVGLCQSTPRESYVQRTYSCSYFRYSERAMVRDRLAQKPTLLHQIRVIRADDGQTEDEK